MNRQQSYHIPVTLSGLNEKLDFEAKRLIREREEGIIKFVSKKAVLNGNSTLIFKDKRGATVKLSYRLDKSGTLRFAREDQFSLTSPQEKNRPAAARVGRTSMDIGA